MEEIFLAAAQNKTPPPSAPLRDYLDVVLENGEKNKGVLAVLATLLLKKAASPEQDIRRHQKGMTGGFAGRGLDAETVTPFFWRNNFPAMQSGSGWLTRSLEQARPYDLEYPGKIQPPRVKSAFLGAVDRVQTGGECARTALAYLLAGLIRRRDQSDAIRLSRPTNLTIAQVVARLRRHFSFKEKGASRLPVLAVYAAYFRLAREMDRYRGCELLPLESHTAADQKTGLLGDVQVNRDGLPMEAVEIKHGVRITPGIARDCYGKFRKTAVKTFYLLSTDSEIPKADAIAKIADRVRAEHGCQLIVNGVLETLAYYLRLMKDTSAFVDEYAGQVETDKSVNYALKMAWEAAGEEKKTPAPGKRK